jgi:hypothetical protein
MMIFKVEDTGIRIVRGHSDGGKEYENLEGLEDHLATYSAPYTPENNPTSERGNIMLGLAKSQQSVKTSFGKVVCELKATELDFRSSVPKTGLYRQ